MRQSSREPPFRLEHIETSLPGWLGRATPAGAAHPPCRLDGCRPGEHGRQAQRWRQKYAPYASTLERAGAVGTDTRRRLLELADEDSRAYDGFAAAMKMPHETPVEIAGRQATIRAAARAATDVPMEVVQVCRTVAAELESLAGRSNMNASSDLLVGALLTDAAARGAAANVFINLSSVGDPDFEDHALLGVTTARADRGLRGPIRLVVGLASCANPRT
jgi:glutamate formiminotransferase/formiminotetrahydrofolate cyclodeaminase